MIKLLMNFVIMYYNLNQLILYILHSYDKYIYVYKLITNNNERTTIKMVYKSIDRLMLNSTKKKKFEEEFNKMLSIMGDLVLYIFSIINFVDNLMFKCLIVYKIINL